MIQVKIFDKYSSAEFLERNINTFLAKHPKVIDIKYQEYTFGGERYGIKHSALVIYEMEEESEE